MFAAVVGALACARAADRCRCRGARFAAAISAPGRGLTRATSASELGSPPPHEHQCRAQVRMPQAPSDVTGMPRSRKAKVGAALTVRQPRRFSQHRLFAATRAKMPQRSAHARFHASAILLRIRWPWHAIRLRLGSPLPHLRRDWAHRCHICTGTGLTAATSALGLGSPLPHLHRDCTQREQSPVQMRDATGHVRRLHSTCEGACSGAHPAGSGPRMPAACRAACYLRRAERVVRCTSQRRVYCTLASVAGFATCSCMPLVSCRTGR
jgi:hypothetical protein